ncbi:hypothetical protein ACIA5D_50945 [Actinoplanes sp. NPDC051513]
MAQVLIKIGMDAERHLELFDLDLHVCLDEVAQAQIAQPLLV